MKNLSLSLLLLFLFSCNEKEYKELTIIELIPTKTISQLDTLFFINVSIFADEEKNYVLSRSPAFLAATDKEFNLLWVHSAEGSGPSDLSFPEQGKSDGKELFVLNHGNFSLKGFNTQSGGFVSSIKVSEPFMKFRFDRTNQGYGYFNVYSPADSISVIQTDVQGTVTGRFGAVFPERSGPNRQMKYFQLDEKGNVILIGASLPFIEILNAGGKSLNRFDIEKYEPIKRALDSLEMDIIKGERITENSIPSFVKDAQYANGKLYVSFTDRVGTDRTNARNLLVFRLNEDECELETMYKFRTGTDDDNLHPGYFYVDSFSKKLYVQGLITKQIYIFDLPD
jgi:hypothetical protein